MEMDINTELTELRNEASFLRKENFDLKEKIQDWVRNCNPKIFHGLILRTGRTHFKELEEKVRDLNRVVATIQRKFLEGVQVLVFAMSGDTWFRNS